MIKNLNRIIKIGFYTSIAYLLTLVGGNSSAVHDDAQNSQTDGGTINIANADVYGPSGPSGPSDPCCPSPDPSGCCDGSGGGGGY